MTSEQGVPFDVALRRALDARGLSLDRIAERLIAAGTPVSVSTLSNWQRGTTTPTSQASRQAVVELEAILGLPSGQLMAALAPYGGSMRQIPTRAGLAKTPAEHLRAGFGAASSDLVTVRLDEHSVVRGAEMFETTYMTVRAERPGVDKRVFVLHPDEGPDPVFEGGPTSRLGEVRRDEKSNLFAAELLFDAPLTRGEHYPVAFTVRSPMSMTDGYKGTWVRAGLASYSLTLEFERDHTPDHVYRVWRETPHSPHKRLADLRLIEGRFAHIWLRDPPPGFHGIRWE